MKRKMESVNGKENNDQSMTTIKKSSTCNGDSQNYVNINGIPEETIYHSLDKYRPLKLVPLTSDPECAKLREECNYSERIPLEVALRGEQKRPLRVYNSGVFDMFHFGHAQALRQSKTYFKGPVHLIVGVSGDEDCEKQKRKPIMSVEERVNCIRHCIWADEICAPSPWITSPEFIAENKIDFVCHDSVPYKCSNTVDIFAWLKEANMFVTTKRTDSISTTDIIERLQNKIKFEMENGPPERENL